MILLALSLLVAGEGGTVLDVGTYAEVPTSNARGPSKPSLTVRAYPMVSLATPFRQAIVHITAELVGPETEEFYCPMVVFVQAEGTMYRQESVEESGCVPFKERDIVPPRAPWCQARIIGGQFYPSSSEGACAPRDAPGFPRRWHRDYAFDPCPLDDMCHYRISVLLKHAGRTLASDGVTFMVR